MSLQLFFLNRYDKTEDLTAGSSAMLNHTHVILAATDDNDEALQPYASSFSIMDRVYKSTYKLRGLGFPPFSVEPKPVIYLLKQNGIGETEQ